VARRSDVVAYAGTAEAIGKLGFSVETLRIVSHSNTGIRRHKVCRPGVIGAVTIRIDTPLRQEVAGGSQKRRQRSEPDSVVGIEGPGRARQLALSELGAGCRRLMPLRQQVCTVPNDRTSTFVTRGIPTTRNQPNTLSHNIPV
jgi:cysteine sulfinate desulfinase/cysteine desulfurase-like protein